MTALFSPTETALPTVTPPAVQTATPAPPTPSPEASFTQAPPTEPTGTSAPAPTSSPGGIPGVRPGTSIQASFLAVPPTIDGDTVEWTQGSYPVVSVVYGVADHSGEADLSGSVWVGWDQANLYIGAHVRDDRYAQNATGKDLYRGDSVEILLDTRLAVDFYVNNLSPDDFQLGISPGQPSPGNGMEAYLWYPTSITGARSQVRVAARQTGDGYSLEAAIPWTVLEMVPESGAHYGFAFSISDNDSPSEDLQESMVSTISTRRLTDPTTWGDLTLSGE